HVGDHRAAALLEQAEGAIDLLDLEHDGAHPLRVLAQVAEGAAAFARRRAYEERHVPGAEDCGALPPARGELGARLAELREVELIDHEVAHAAEIVDVVDQRRDLADAERGQRRGGLHGAATVCSMAPNTLRPAPSSTAMRMRSPGCR